MKKLNYFLSLCFFFSILLPVSAQIQEKVNAEEGVSTPKVTVYYFHYSRRCATCNAVEDVSRSLVIDNYGKNVDFEACNLDEDEGASIGEELGVSGQTLLVVGLEKQFDVTSEAFLNARNKPEKLKALLSEKIDHLL